MQTGRMSLQSGRISAEPKMMAYMQVFLYACMLIKVAKPHVANPLRYITWLVRQNPVRRKLRVLRISVKDVLVRAQRESCCELDLNAVVFISEKTAISLGLRNGQWKSVLFHHGTFCKEKCCALSLTNTGRRWIQVLTCSTVEKMHCLVSPVLYHNLHKNCKDPDFTVEFVQSSPCILSEPVKKVLAIWNGTHGHEISKTKSLVTPCSPGMASEIHVKIIESALYKYRPELELLLKDYFRIPKIVAVNDTLILSIPSHLAYEFAPSNTVVPPSHILVKVVRVKGKSEVETRQCVQAAVGTTSLYLAGTINSSHPPYKENFDIKGEIDVPPVLRETYLKLRNILKVVMQNRSQTSKGSGNSSKANSNPATPNTSSRRLQDKLDTPSTQQNPKAVRQHQNHKLGSEDSVKNTHNTINSIAILLLGPPGYGSEQVTELAALAIGADAVWENCWQLKGDTAGATEARLRQVFVRALALRPCVLVLKHVHCLSKDRDGEENTRVVAALKEEVAKLNQVAPCVVVVGTAPDRTALSDDLWSVWSYQESVCVPDLDQRSAMVQWLCGSHLTEQQVLTLAQRTAGYVLGDFHALRNAAQRQCLEGVAETEVMLPEDSWNSSVTLQYCHLLKALDELQVSRSETLGAPHIPQVLWGEVGGLEEAKRQIINTIQLPLRYPSLAAGKLRHSGVLLYGPPGTGKTLLAKAVATECGLSFLSVKGPELLNMYVGQSEENVRQVFCQARAAAPCVVFFDELDSLAPNRGHSGDSGGVMDRIVSALLAELDEVAETADIFVLAATNRPDLLDTALLRPGRFDKLVFVGVCKDHEGQVKILRAVTSKVPLSPSVSLERLSRLLPLTLTGADLYALVTDALYTALRRCTEEVHAGRLQEGEAAVLITEEDLEVAARNLIPSVSPKELAHYHSLNTAVHR